MSDNQYPPQPSPIREGRNAASPFTLHFSLKQRAAFTLAEVLITLGVIGVVAALTMPSLIAHYQKKVLVTQIKKAYSTLNEGFRQIMINEGCTDLICAGLIYTEYGSSGEFYLGSIIINDSNLNKLATTFKLSDFSNTKNIFDYEIKSLNGDVFDFDPFSNGRYTGVTPDGMFLLFSSEMEPLVFFDVNGRKGPNVFGRDIFGVMIIDTMLTPMYSQAFLRFAAGSNIIPDDMSEDDRISLIKQACSPESDEINQLTVCLERIILDGWEMNY